VVWKCSMSLLAYSRAPMRPALSRVAAPDRSALPTLKGLQSYLHHCNPYLPLNGELHCMYMSNYTSLTPPRPASVYCFRKCDDASLLVSLASQPYFSGEPWEERAGKDTSGHSPAFREPPQECRRLKSDWFARNQTHDFRHTYHTDRIFLFSGYKILFVCVCVCNGSRLS